tara:strand:- start:955 stop:1251 length:297 start_codon:yes stop_codon:yes gene_type:complete
MKKHTKIYIDSLGYYTCDFMPCEITGRRGVDIHHIVNRENRIENLMLLTREKHVELGEIKSKMSYLLCKHRYFLQVNGVKFDNKWFEEHLSRYKEYEN